MNTQLSNYSDQLEGIAAYARAINFNAETGNYDELMKGWYKRCMSMSSDIKDNQKEVTKRVRNIIGI